MLIKTKLAAISVVAAVSAVCALSNLAWTDARLKRSLAEHHLVEELINSAFKRIALRDEYLLFHDERPKEQWLRQSEHFSELLKRYLDLIGVDGADRVFSRIDPAQAALFGEAGPAGGLAGPPAESDSPSRLVEDGGPMGPQPTDANALAQFLQMQAQAGLGREP